MFRFHGSVCLLFYVLFFFLMHCHWFSGHDANLLMILALLTGCWCLDYILLLHPPYIGVAFLSLSQRTFLAASISSLFPLSLIASFCFSPFLFFSENIQRDKGVCFLWTYGDCSRRFALVSGPATGLIVGPGPHF